jgi:hypothetical protein
MAILPFRNPEIANPPESAPVMPSGQAAQNGSKGFRGSEGRRAFELHPLSAQRMGKGKQAGVQ